MRSSRLAAFFTSLSFAVIAALVAGVVVGALAQGADTPVLTGALGVIERYADLGLGLADASNVVLANRYDTLDVLTLDERHFRVLRGPHDRPFRLLPADAD